MSYEKVTEGPHAAEFILSEASGYRSREQGTIASGQELEAGTVLGQITASGLYTQYDPDATDGSETAAAVLYGYVDATESDTPGALFARDGEVDGAKLIWPAGADEEVGAADLAEQNIHVR